MTALKLPDRFATVPRSATVNIRIPYVPLCIITFPNWTKCPRPNSVA